MYASESTENKVGIFLYLDSDGSKVLGIDLFFHSLHLYLIPTPRKWKPVFISCNK